MPNGTESQEAYFVGTTANLEELRRAIANAGEILQSAGDEPECVVMLRAPARFRDDFLRHLGPNAQMVGEEREARRAFEAATVAPEGAPYEPRRAQSG